MSTRSTIFLTEDNEHCYSDCSLPQFIGDEFSGNSIVMEFDKKNINVLVHDKNDLIIELKDPTSEIYKIIEEKKHIYHLSIQNQRLTEVAEQTLKMLENQGLQRSPFYKQIELTLNKL